MKRVPYYRRGNAPGDTVGIAERIVWQLSKRPMTPTQLAEALNIDRHRANEHVRRLSKSTSVARISLGDLVPRPGGGMEQVYIYEGVGDRPFPKAGRPMLVNHRSAKNTTPEMHKACVERAKRRARLIKAGLYIDEMG